MMMTIELRYSTNKKEPITDLYTLLYSIITYDVIEIVVSMGGIEKTFVLISK